MDFIDSSAILEIGNEYKAIKNKLKKKYHSPKRLNAEICKKMGTSVKCLKTMPKVFVDTTPDLFWVDEQQ